LARHIGERMPTAERRERVADGRDGRDGREQASSTQGPSQSIAAWVTAASGLGAALTGLIGALFPGPEQRGRQIAYTLAIVLLVGSACAAYVWKRRRKRIDIPAPLPVATTAALRSLLPFVEGDRLLGRDADVQALVALIDSNDGGFGVLFGESGSGKTSLLRAGLLPRLRQAGYLPIYVSRSGSDPLGRLAASLREPPVSLIADAAKPLGDQVLTALATASASGPASASASAAAKKVVVIFDQFEEFFLSNRRAENRGPFMEWLAAYRALESQKLFVLVSLRDDYFVYLQQLSSVVPEPTSPRHTYGLRNFPAQVATEVLMESLRADGIEVSAELVRAAIQELERDGDVRPPELQIVGTHIKRRRISSLNEYRAIDGAPGIIGSYIKEEIARSPHPQLASLLLRRMCHANGLVRAPNYLTLPDLAAGVLEGDTRTTDDVERILSLLHSARIVDRDDEGAFNLQHDYLAPLVLRATEGLETKHERANRLLNRYLAEYRLDKRIRVPMHLVDLVAGFADPTLLNQHDVATLIKKSRRGALALRLGPVVIVAALVGVPYAVALPRYYFSAIPPHPPSWGTPIVVVKGGHPTLRSLPFTGNVVVETDVRLADFPKDSAALVERIRREEVSGWRLHTAKNYREWQEHLLAFLTPLSRARFSAMLGDPVRTATTLRDEVHKREAACAVARELEVLTLTTPEAMTDDLRARLLSLAMDKSQAAVVRMCAAASLGVVLRHQPQHAAEADAVLLDVATFVGTTIDFRSMENEAKNFADWAAFTLANAHGGPASRRALEEFMKTAMTARGGLLSDHRATSAVLAVAAAEPALVTSEVIENLWRVTSFGTRPAAAAALMRPQAVTGEVLTRLAKHVVPDGPSAARRVDLNVLFDLFRLGIRNSKDASSWLATQLRQIANDTRAAPGSRERATVGLAGLLSLRTPLAAKPYLARSLELATQLPEPMSDTPYAEAAVMLMAFVPPDRLGSGAAQIMEAQLTPYGEDNDRLTSFEWPAPMDEVLAAYAHSRPNGIPPAIIDKLIGVAKDSRVSGRNALAASVLLAIAPFQPEHLAANASEMEKIVVGDSFGGEGYLPDLVTAALARARYAVKTKGRSRDELIPAFIDGLRIPDSAVQRLESAYSLFYAALDDPRHDHAIRQGLQALRDSVQPHERIAAARTLELLEVAKLAASVKNNPAKRSALRRRLEILREAEAPIGPAARVALWRIAAEERARADDFAVVGTNN
jgi:hypothetical protein